MNSRISSGLINDVWEIATSWIYNSTVLFSQRNAALETLHIVTAADSSHGDSLIQLLGSIQAHESQALVTVVDMGLSAAQLENIRQSYNSLDMEITEFPFVQYPAFFNITVNAGEYAWKPTIIFNTSLTSNARVLLWLDAGDVITGKLIAERHAVLKHGFWSPKSAGNLQEWTHPGLLSKFRFSRRQLRSRNLNGAIIGFCPRLPQSQLLLELWALTAKEKSWIAPEGSNRENHRQDQALLSTLAVLLRMNTRPSRASRILLHQDVDQEK